MDSRFLPQLQNHPGNYSHMSVHEEYNFLNTMPDSSSSMMSQNQTGGTISKIGFQQNRPMYTANSSYLPTSHHSSEFLWTQMENSNSIQYQPQNNMKTISEQYVLLHSNANMYLCETCKGEFPNKHNLEQHRLTHLKEKHHFELNNESAWATPALTEQQNHTKELEKSINNVKLQCSTKVQNDSKKFVCKTCSKSLCSKQSLTIHLRMHTGEKPFVCSVCEKRFTEKNKLTKHLRNHTGEKPYICDVCKEAFTYKKQLNRHKVDVHIGKRPFSCDICNNGFVTEDDLKRHHKVVHSGEKPYVCELCSKAFQNRTKLERHQVVHNGERRFHCEICNLRFKYSHHYKHHLKVNEIVEKDGIKSHVRIKSTKKEFDCDICAKAFTCKRNLIYHSRRHKGDTHIHSYKHVCDACGRSFQYKSQLNKHKMRHNNKSEIVCTLCNLQFLTKVSLERHRRKVHQVKPFICKICNKHFSAIECLRKHNLNPNVHKGILTSAVIPFQNQTEGIRSDFQIKVNKIIESGKYFVQHKNGRKLFFCPVCNKKLNSKQRLVVHCRIHTDEKPFVCKICEKGFHDKYLLKRHVRKHSEKISSIESKSLIQSNIKKTLKCTVCAKLFMSVSSMISHRYTHIIKKLCLTNSILDKQNIQTRQFHNYPNILNIYKKESVEAYVERNKCLNCNVCNKTFSSIFSLIKHKKHQILKKRFVCDLCKGLFISKSSLELHLSHQKNKKSFTCDICPATFHKQSLFNIHLQAHTNEILIVCKICKKTFPNESALQKHENLHIGRILYVCRICKKHFTSYHTYNGHVQNHTVENHQLLESQHLLESKSVIDTSIVSQKQKEISTIEKPFNDKKFFVCAICPKSFDDSDACIRHMELHTKTHVCWICNRKFDQERIMNHMQTHVGKPYVCGMCPKSFSDKNGCVTHMKLHTEKNPSCC